MTFFQTLVSRKITVICLALHSPLFLQVCLCKRAWFYLHPDFRASTRWHLIHIFAGPTQGCLLHQLISNSLCIFLELRINDFVVRWVFYEPGVKAQGWPLHCFVSPTQAPAPMDVPPCWDCSAWLEFSCLTNRDWDGEHVGRRSISATSKSLERKRSMLLWWHQMRQRKEETAWGRRQPSEWKISTGAQWNHQDLFF